MWKIKQIFDGDYGCEELAEGQTLKVSVMLVNEAGTKKYITVEDKWLTDNGLMKAQSGRRIQMNRLTNAAKYAVVIMF